MTVFRPYKHTVRQVFQNSRPVLENIVVQILIRTHTVFHPYDKFILILWRKHTGDTTAGQSKLQPGPNVITPLSCSTELSMKFKLLFKMRKHEVFSLFNTLILRCCIYHANKNLNANKLAYMSMIKFMLSGIQPNFFL